MTTPNEEVNSNASNEATSETASNSTGAKPNKTDVKASNPKVILLGVYLLLFLLTSLFFLSNLIMVDPCPMDVQETTATNTSTPTSTPTPTSSPTPSPTTTQPPTNSPINTATSSPTPNPTSNKPTNSTTNTANVNAKAPNSNTNQRPMDTELGKPTIARFVRVNFWGFFKDKSEATNNNSNNSNANKSEADTNANSKENDSKRCNETVERNQYLLSADGYLFLVVLFGGLLGASVRSIWSLVKHIVFLKNFSYVATWYYITLPFTGSALALVIYFVLRGGFYGAPIGNALILNTFSFAALAMVTGLFTGNAMRKLEQIAAIILAPLDDDKKNNKPPKDDPLK